MALICDTGGLFALYDADDSHHAASEINLRKGFVSSPHRSPSHLPNTV